MYPYRGGKGPIVESSLTNATYAPSPRRAQLPVGPVNPGPRRTDFPMSGLEDRLNYGEEENRRLADQLQALKKKFEHLNTYKDLQMQLNESVRGNQIQAFKKQNFAQIDTMNSEINMLSGVLQMRQDETDDLKLRNSNLENDNRVLMDSEYRLKDLEAKTAAVLQELNVRSSECEGLTDRVNELDLRLKESNEENIKLRDILHARTNDNANLEAKLTDFETEVNNMRRLELLDKENEGNMLATIHQLELKIAHNESFVDNLKKMNHVEFEKYRAHIERIKNALSDKDKEVFDLRDEGAQLLNHLDLYKQKENELLRELDDLRNDFDHLRADREQQIQALEDQIAHLRSEVAVRERELLNLNDRLAKAEARINELLVENAELMKVLENLKIKFAELERSHSNEVEMREAKFRGDAQLMEQNLQDAIDRYQSEIQDIKRVLERKDNEILGIKQEFLNQSQQNESLQRREEALLNELRQAQFRVEESDREKDMQIAYKEEKHRNQLQTIKRIHAAEFDSLKEESNELHALIKGKSDENESLAQQNSNFLDNYHKIKASEVRLISESENLKGKLSRLEYVKNKEVYNQEELRRSQLGHQSRQHSDEIEHLREEVFAMENLLQDRVQEVEDWKRKTSTYRQDPRFV